MPLAAQIVEPGAVAGTGILKPLGLDTSQERWNIDGMLASARGDSRGGLGYAQLFRDGHFETVNAALLDWLRLRDETSSLSTASSSRLRSCKALRIRCASSR